MNEPDVVNVRGLRKAYGSRVVVDRLDLDVHVGEIVGLVGSNGAGKTTTVECLQGLRRPDGGTLSVLGLDPSHRPQVRPFIGSQLQSSALPDRLRMGEAVELFATSRASDGGELLEQFGLAEQQRSAFFSLSGGERQRLFLVLALLNRHAFSHCAMTPGCLPSNTILAASSSPTPRIYSGERDQRPIRHTKEQT